MPTFRNDSPNPRVVPGHAGIIQPGQTVETHRKLDVLNPAVWTRISEEPRADPTRDAIAASESAEEALALEVLDADSSGLVVSVEVIAGGPATAGTLAIDVRAYGLDGWQELEETMDLLAPAPVVLDAPVSAVRLRQIDVAPGTVRLRAVARWF